LPFLGSDYGVALQNGEIPLHFDASRRCSRPLRTPFPDLPGRLRLDPRLSRRPALQALAEHFTP
jgi:(1->4)-alpha-D-glucan 1-alpha-D-glucosylmutase